MRRLNRAQVTHVAPRARTLTLQTAQRARRAKWELLAVIPLFALTLVAYIDRERIFGVDTPVRVAAAVVMVVLGWRLARDFGRFTAPALFRRMDPATAGTVGFLIRLTFLLASAIVALRIAGIRPDTLAVGGAITAVVFGLAAQQTLGNLIAGVVLLSARPFRVGDRVRLQAGNLAGQIEGVVASLGLLYTTFTQGQDEIMVPNNTVLSAAIVPLREPAAVDLRARLRPDVKPSAVQALLEDAVSTPVRGEPSISLEEVDSDEVVVRIQATPLADADGPRLADEVLAAVASVTADAQPHAVGAGRGDAARGADGTNAPGGLRSPDAPAGRRSPDAPGGRRSPDAPGGRRGPDGERITQEYES
jgi:small-conductance mechanosensitive channel